jgi:hypothetical protein
MSELLKPISELPLAVLVVLFIFLTEFHDVFQTIVQLISLTMSFVSGFFRLQSKREYDISINFEMSSEKSIAS